MKIYTLFVKSGEEVEGESARKLAAPPRKRAKEESDLLEAPSISEGGEDSDKRCLLQLGESTRGF